MDTSNLKRFAQTTRIRLLEAVQDILEYVLNLDAVVLRDYAASVHTLKKDVERIGKEALIDKVAYTWFNRLMALRFMDANGYQPLRLMVISPKEGFTQPETLDEAMRGYIPEELRVDKTRINDLLDGKITSPNPQNEVYRMLLVASCNYLHSLFPFLFEQLNDYTELLLPDDLISELSIIHDFVEGMTQEDCQEVEVMGWLYQFYIADRKEEVFAAKGRVKKEDIPSATQLFTPRWIVEYMLQNTVSKLWLQNNPHSSLRKKMPYYIETDASKSDDFLKISSPEELTLLDQACGSGHILVYGFELLYHIYE
ncbi:MAG: class I SAM-dependent DNA methyltransferase, partial [Erysipelothrix sp.]|nr:class I SAM-dependent DNA methyltransferase [Erysipelothrix sp.]